MDIYNTRRVLTCDGGGARGVIPVVFLKLLEETFNVDIPKLGQQLDVVAGSSAGAIVAAGIAYGLTPDVMLNFCVNEAPWVFSTSTTTPSQRPSLLTKINVLLGGPFNGGSFYPNSTEGIGKMRLRAALEQMFGSTKLNELETKIIITAVKRNYDSTDITSSKNSPVFFSNISSDLVPYCTGQDMLLVDALLASAAAPLYFPTHEINGQQYIDGGIAQNNPSAFALAAAQAIKPSATRDCVLSIGTGLGEVGFAPEEEAAAQEVQSFLANPEQYVVDNNVTEEELPQIISFAAQSSSLIPNLAGAKEAMFTLSAAIAAAQEVVGAILDIRANYTLEQLNHYRFQYYLDEPEKTELDDTRPELLEYYRTSAEQKFNTDLNKINTFWSKFTA